MATLLNGSRVVASGNFESNEIGIIHNDVVHSFSAGFRLIDQNPPSDGIWSFFDGQFFDASPGPVEVPYSVTRRQAKQGLLLAGKLDDVQPAIDAIPDEIERRMAQLYWDESQDFERDNEVLQMMAQAIGMTPDEVDNLFIQASKL